jgi:hypothetical protein
MSVNSLHIRQGQELSNVVNSLPCAESVHGERLVYCLARGTFFLVSAVVGTLPDLEVVVVAYLPGVRGHVGGSAEHLLDS